jgi:DNA-binding CsgD family transcriptional regulator
MKLPAGMVDRDFEFFLYQGNLMVMHNGKIKSFDTMPAKLKYYLVDILANDPDANLCLDCMNIHDTLERLRQFVLCRFSSFDLVADITEGGHMSPEFTLCEKRGRCHYEGTLCLSFADTSKLSSRELEVIRFIAQDLPNKLIADKMDISVNTVSTHIQAIQNKIGVHSKYGILSWAFKHDLIDMMPEKPAIDHIVIPINN